MRLDFALSPGAGRGPGSGPPPPPPPPPPPDDPTPPPHWAVAALAGATGFAYDPSTSEGLFQDVAGEVPVAADGQTVALMRDRSGQGFDALQPDSARRPVWRTDGARGWLEFDGQDHEMEVPRGALSPAATAFLTVVELAGDGFYPTILGDVSLSDGFFAGFGNSGARRPRFATVGHDPGALLAADALPVGTRAALLYEWDGAARRVLRDGAELLRDAQTGPWVQGTQPLLCYSGSNVIRTPVRFYGGLCADRGLTAAEVSEISARMGRAPALGEALVLGDSTVAAYSGAPSVASLLGSARQVRDFARPGDSIAQQHADWTAAGIAPRADGWAMVQLGLNDLQPAEAAEDAIARLQALVDAIAADTGGLPVLVAQMTPARARLQAIYGAQGDVAQAKWAAINAAVAGSGPMPITDVAGRVTAHVARLDDGTGALAAAYDTGDHIHPNAAGREVIAEAWTAALRGLGLTV